MVLIEHCSSFTPSPAYDCCHQHFIVEGDWENAPAFGQQMNIIAIVNSLTPLFF